MTSPPVRFAFFMMVHHKPYQFEWLLNAIYNPHDTFLVHVDLKTALGLKKDRRGVYREVRRLIADKPNVFLMAPRFTNWGGWTLSKVMLDAMAMLLSNSREWTHFINLSGQCYTTRALDEIRAKIGAQPAVQFVELRHFDSLPEDDWHLRRAAMLETPIKAIALPLPRRVPGNFELAYKGSQWVILTRSFCEWIGSDKLARSIANYLQLSHLTDELIIQTLLRNSPFRERIAAHYGRAIIWPGPKILGMSDYELLKRDDIFFGRKFDVRADARVLQRLAQDCQARPGPLA